MAQGGSSTNSIDFGKITLGQEIGAGGFGTVYKANLEVAVKKIENPNRKTYKREITQLLELNHRNIVKIYGASQNGTDIYLVMELAEDGSLDDALYKSSSQPTFRMSVWWGFQCANGVAYLHGQKIVHRDLKPRNCLLFENKEVLKICDFGLARPMTDQSMTQGVGTPRYMAPEVIQGKHYTEKCDVYSWGLLMWELHAHKRPFDGEDAVEAKSHGETPPPLAEVKDSEFENEAICKMNALLKRCWAKEPSERPTMSEVQKDTTELRLYSMTVCANPFKKY